MNAIVVNSIMHNKIDKQLINRYDYYNKFKEFLIFIKVDENCNLRCSFCYQGEKEHNRIDTEEKLNNCIKNLCFGIDRFLEIKSDDKYEFAKLKICFFGGEPTLNLPAIKNICNKLKLIYSKEVLNNIYFSMTTNGIIFNDEVIEVLKIMKTMNDNYIGIMVSSDNEKEIYDKNRTLVGSDKSGFEIVQKNIKEYKKVLKEINNSNNDNFVVVATVLATSEQLRKTPKIIQDVYKNINRSGKLLYDLSHQSTDYIEESKNFLLKAYSYLINNCNKNNKFSSIEIVMEAIWQLHSKDCFTECQSIFSIDGNGDVNWCNKHKNFEKEILSQDEMREKSIFNINTDNTHFQCYKDKLAGGKVSKDVIRPKLWEMMISKFDPNVPISKINIYNTDYDLYNFIKYMIGSTQSEEKEIYIKNPTEKVKKLCEELEIKLSSIPVTSDENNIFYIDKNGNLFFDELFKENKEMILTNIKEKHFIWIHTPTLLKSINNFYFLKLSEFK